MGRFDWADKGIFDIAALTDAEFKAHFNSMTAEEKKAILEDLDDEAASAEEKKKAVDFVARLGRAALETLALLT